MSLSPPVPCPGEDVYAASRLNSYIANARMPWDSQEPGPIVSVGSLNVWLRDGKGDWSCVLSN